jgi:hypothetical protein
MGTIAHDRSIDSAMSHIASLPKRERVVLTNLIEILLDAIEARLVVHPDSSCTVHDSPGSAADPLLDA